MEQKRKVEYMVIPIKLWESDDLNANEVVLYCEIKSLDNERGCFASNAYLAKFMKVSVRRVQQLISDLIEKGYITSIIEDEENGQQRRILKANHRDYYFNTPPEKNSTPPLKKIAPPPRNNFQGGCEKNCTHNNTVINTSKIKEESVTVNNSNTPAFDFSILKTDFYKNYLANPRKVEQAIWEYFSKIFRDEDEAREEFANFIAHNSENEWCTQDGKEFYNLMPILKKWVTNQKAYYAPIR